MVTTIYVILAILSIVLFTKNRMPEMALCLTFMMSNLFGFALALGGTTIKPYDFLIVSACVIYIIGYTRDHSFFSIKSEGLAKILLLTFLWIVIVFLGTIVFGQETPSYAFKVFRIYLLMPLYFVFRQMSMNQVEKFFKYVLTFSIIQGVFFYLQLVGVTGVLSGYGSELESGEILAEHRFGNYPVFAAFFFVSFFLNDNLSLIKRIVYCLFWGMMPIIGQMRGATICLALAITIYFFVQRKAKYVLYVGIAAMAFQLVAAPMFEKRESRHNVGTIEEIASVFSNPLAVYSNYAIEEGGGTFSFRIAMFAERIQFMLDNPQYAFSGVGCIHEHSPKQIYTFNIGTYSPDSKYGSSQLASADIEWVGVLMHFGFIGVLLWTLMYFGIIGKSVPLIRESTSHIFTVVSCSSVGLYFISYDSSSIDRPAILITLLYVAIISIYRREQYS